MLRKLDPEIHHGLRCSAEVLEKGGKEPLVREGAKLTKGLIAKLKAAGVKEIPLAPTELVGRAVLTELVDSKKNKIAEKISGSPPRLSRRCSKATSKNSRRSISIRSRLRR